MPDDLKTQCISLVRGYKRRVLVYHERRNAVIYESPPPSDGTPKGNIISNPTEDKILRLEKVENLFDTRAMRAVEQSKLLIGNDLPEDQRQKLTAAIWDSCIGGRNFRFGCYELPVGKTNFYERRREFLWDIAMKMEFIQNCELCNEKQAKCELCNEKMIYNSSINNKI